MGKGRRCYHRDILACNATKVADINRDLFHFRLVTGSPVVVLVGRTLAVRCASTTARFRLQIGLNGLKVAILAARGSPYEDSMRFCDLASAKPILLFEE
ncbi:hypothetical protein RRG08_052591 [Elysia crispata]|uniref:Uncharacterized protein n=1 Tax=Elysia crispata TaxID=231223 RepID=A0AAE1DQQ4_9GAST|nr:hypothetical protein RRG08_052591 [Elysia crispata]